MKSFWGLIPRYLWKNKKRVFSIGSAITLSVFLIMSLFIMKEEKIKIYNEKCSNVNGSFNDLLANIRGTDEINILRNDERVKEMTLKTEKFATAAISGTEYYFVINSYDDNADELMNIDFIEGRKPEKDYEIAIESWVMPYLDKAYGVGDIIEMDCDLDPSADREKIVKYKFKITGIMSVNCTSYRFKNGAAVWVKESFTSEEAKKYNMEPVDYQANIYLKDGRNLEKAAIEFNNDDRYTDTFFLKNYAKQKAIENENKLDMASEILFVVMGIVVAINIYNIFSVTMEERKKEFGILRSMGCSKIKIRSMVICEGLIIGILSIFTGIILGNVITKGVMCLIGYMEIKSIITVPSGGVKASLIIGMLAVMLGVFFPIRKIEKISAIDSMNSHDVNKKLTGRKGNIPHGRLSFVTKMVIINIRGNRKRFLTSVISIAITLVLMMSTVYLLGQVNPLSSFKKQYGASEFKITTNNYFTADEVDSIDNISGIGVVSKEKSEIATINVNKEQITENGYDYVKSTVKGSKSGELNLKEGVYSLNLQLIAYEGEKINQLDKYLIEGKIEYSEEGTPGIYIIQGINNYKYTDIKPGDIVNTQFNLIDDKGNVLGLSNGRFKVRAIIDSKCLNSYDSTVSIAGIISDEDAVRYLGLTGYNLLRVNSEEGFDYEEVRSNLKHEINAMRKADLSEYREEYAKQKKENIKLSFILYTFAFSVGVISLINLINIMKIKILMMQQEVGLLRATGFGIDEVKKMIMTEGAVYGIAAGIIGTGFGTLLTYVISRTVWYLSWTLPVMKIVVIFSGTIVITTVTSLISSRELFKTSIVDSIRAVE